MGWIELIAFVIFIVLFAAIVIQLFVLRKTNKELFAIAAQGELDKKALLDAIERLKSEKEQKSVEQTDGFLRFISESREAAFGYIEDVQDALSYFDDKIGPVVKQYRDTGRVKEIKLSELVKEIADVYDKLMEAMPQENNGAE